MKMLDAVIDSLLVGEIKEIHLGDHWNAVVAEIDGHTTCGMASNPARRDNLAQAARQGLAASILTRPVREVCRLVNQPDLRLASVAVAAMNALVPRQPERWVDCNAEHVIAQRGAGKRVAMVGHFPSVPKLRAQVGRLDVLELNPQDGDYPASAAPEIIPLADVVAVTGMTLVNGTLEGLLKLCSPKACVVMLGPSVLLSPVLFDYGVDILGGSVVEKIGPVTQAVDDSDFAQEIFPLGVRMVVMSRESAG
jgi:hypothetical protein